MNDIREKVENFFNLIEEFEKFGDRLEKIENFKNITTNKVLKEKIFSFLELELSEDIPTMTKEIEKIEAEILKEKIIYFKKEGEKVQNNTEFEFININDVLNTNFFQLPKFLFYVDTFKKMSNDSKVLYAILRDRLNLSIENKKDFTDKNGNVYVIYTIDELKTIMNRGSEKINKIKKELIKYGLLIEKRQGINKPNLLYPLKLRNFENRKSRISKIENQEYRKSKTNKTNNNKTNNNKTTTKHNVVDEVFIKNYKSEFKKLYEGDLNTKDLEELYLLKGEATLNKYLKEYQLFLDASTKEIRDINKLFKYIVKNESELPKSYKPNKKEPVNKPVQATNYEQREYDDDFFNSLYDNIDYIK